MHASHPSQAQIQAAGSLHVAGRCLEHPGCSHHFQLCPKPSMWRELGALPWAQPAYGEGRAGPCEHHTVQSRADQGAISPRRVVSGAARPGIAQAPLAVTPGAHGDCILSPAGKQLAGPGRCQGSVSPAGDGETRTCCCALPKPLEAAPSSGALLRLQTVALPCSRLPWASHGSCSQVPLMQNQGGGTEGLYPQGKCPHRCVPSSSPVPLPRTSLHAAATHQRSL